MIANGMSNGIMYDAPYMASHAYEIRL